MEFGATYLGTAGELDVSWEPKRRFTTWVKKHSERLPFMVTSWRGAASGVAIDQLVGNEISAKRRLAHAATYGTIMGAYVSEPGSRLFEAMINTGDYVIHNPIVGSIGVLASGAAILRGVQPVDQSK